MKYIIVFSLLISCGSVFFSADDGDWLDSVCEDGRLATLTSQDPTGRGEVLICITDSLGKAGLIARNLKKYVLRANGFLGWRQRLKDEESFLKWRFEMLAGFDRGVKERERLLREREQFFNKIVRWHRVRLAAFASGARRQRSRAAQKCKHCFRQRWMNEEAMMSLDRLSNLSFRAMEVLEGRF